MFHILFTVHPPGAFSEVYRLTLDAPTRSYAERAAIERAKAFTAGFGCAVSYKIRKARS